MYKSAVFTARLWIGTKEDGIVEKFTWDENLTPLEGLSNSEWGSYHLDDITLEELRPLLDVANTKRLVIPEENFEILGSFLITGSWSGTPGFGEEYEETLDVIWFMVQELPKEFLYEKEAERKKKEITEE